MTGPDSGDTDDDDAGDGTSDHRFSGPGDDPSSDGTAAPDDTYDDATAHRSTEAGRRSTSESGRTDGDAIAAEQGSATRTPDSSNAGAGTDEVTIAEVGIVRWFLRTDDESVVLARDILSSVALVALIGLLLFGISGIWPPLVAVESGSMEPNMQEGDLIFIVDDDRFVGDDPIDGTGIVTRETGQDSGHEKFSQPGDVIVFKPDGSDRRTPVIHRAHFWVEKGENWVDTKANQKYLGGATCAEVQACPAPHDGFVTKGDDNMGYDQHYGGAQTNIVKPEWVTGKAMFRIPYLGHIRLAFDSIFGMTAPTSPSIINSIAIEPGLSAGSGQGPGLAGPAGAAATATTGATAAAAITRRRR
ncbi:S26 family signal peptidase [Halosolutus gelatinilyticus]|uniref:S26 family signal peptidase n=1 Tax=Halosolutus gelatinilyticus TaxID=2931975 RepID=UPI001FF5B7FC|nr:S26 family signal peptidase [Halosolutus gelatinilyticus]